VSSYPSRCGDNLVMEGAEIGFPLLGDIGRHDAACSGMLESVRQGTLQQLQKWHERAKYWKVERSNRADKITFHC
jgi:hypothetical protein